MERRHIEWAVVVATFAATGLALGFQSGRLAKTPNGLTQRRHAGQTSAFTQVTFDDTVRSFEFFGHERVVASLENGDLECRSLSGDLLWRISGVEASDLRFTRDGLRILAWSEEYGVRVFNTASGTQTASLPTSPPVAWSASDRYFVAKANGNPVLADAMTGKLRSCAGADDQKTAVSNTGTVYNLQYGRLIVETPTGMTRWNGIRRSSDKAQPKWSFQEQSHFGWSHVTIDTNGDFSGVTTLRISPDGDTLAMGKEDATVELIGLSALYNRGEQRSPTPISGAEVIVVPASAPITWMEWLQEGALAVSYGNETKEDYCLLDSNGELLAHQPDKKQPWISAKGTLTLETRDGKVTARRFLNAQSAEKWTLAASDPAVDTLTRIYGENLAAVANGQTVSFYEIPAP